MIGVISQDILIYGVLERIHNKTPYTMIYLYLSNNIEDGIKELKKKECKMILLPRKEDIEEYQSKYSEITFLALNPMRIEKAYYLEDKNLLSAIENGSEVEVIKILDNLNIKEDIIILNNPRLLFIKKIIEEKFKGKQVLDNIDLLINQIEKNKSLLIEKEEATIKVIKELNR